MVPKPEISFFSFSLKALGLGVLYLSLWAAFQVYNLIPWSVALLAMVIVTGSAAALAVWQSSETLALFALIGGFLTPVLLYTGQSREIELFSYIAILNAATLVLASYRAWSTLTLGQRGSDFDLIFFLVRDLLQE